MKVRQAVLSVMLLQILFIVGGCEVDQMGTTQTFELNTQPVIGSKLLLLPITSTERLSEQKQNEVRARLERIVNGGEYNVTSMKTLYSSCYLTAAEVTYDAFGRGEGNNLRVLFIQSDKNRWSDKAVEIKNHLDRVVYSGMFDIVKINITYAQGYMLAAEVYYRVKR